MATVLVTGASSGIGEACARRLDGLGHRVVAGVRDPEAAGRLRSSSCRVRPVMLDVTDPDQVTAALAEVDRLVGEDGLDGLVNNAGIALAGPVELLPLAEWRRQFEVNLFGQVAVTQAALPAVRRATGRIVFVGSIAGTVAIPFGAAYGASKHAVEAVAQSLREEVRPWGIRVAVVAPGTVRTPIWDKGLEQPDPDAGSMPPEDAERYTEFAERLREQVRKIRDTPVPGPEVVARAVEHALLHPRPRYRYSPGRGVAVVHAAAKVLPDRAVGALVRMAGP
jgi:NAD(P)-dependent dehydrogenase (short-subunit alcohol dehydrogenase family)